MSLSLQRQEPNKSGAPSAPPATFNPAGGPPQAMGQPPGQLGQMPSTIPGPMTAPQQMCGQPGMPLPMQAGGYLASPGQMGMNMPGQMSTNAPPMTGSQVGGFLPGQMPPPSQFAQFPVPPYQLSQAGVYPQPGLMPGASAPPGQAPPQMMGVAMNPPLAAMPGSVSLVKGQNMSITKAAPTLRRALIGLGWDVRQTAGAAFDLDSSCFLLNQQGRVNKPQDFIFYNNKQSIDGSVLHHGDNLTGAGEGDDEQLTVDLTRVPPDVQKVEFVVSIYEAEQRGQNFGMVQRAYIRIVDADTNQEIARYDLTEEACVWTCMIFGELYRYGAEWKFRALGSSVQGGLRGAGGMFGLNLA